MYSWWECIDGKSEYVIMEENTFKKRLNARKLMIGSWITLGHPAIAEIMAKSGFEWLTIDMEHSAITLDQAQQLIQIISLYGITPLVRVGDNNPNIIKRVMDAGAYGVIVPMVNTADDAVNAVRAVKYPPVGSRGVGLARAQGYGMEFEKYKDWVNKESVVIVQIEHIKAVENLEKILSVKDVDGFIIGPYDLAGSLGRPGDFQHREVVEALLRVREIANRFPVVEGFHVIPPDAELVSEKIDEGYKLIGFSLDTLFLAKKCRSELDKVRNKE